MKVKETDLSHVHAGLGLVRLSANRSRGETTAPASVTGTRQELKESQQWKKPACSSDTRGHSGTKLPCAARPQKKLRRGLGWPLSVKRGAMTYLLAEVPQDLTLRHRKQSLCGNAAGAALLTRPRGRVHSSCSRQKGTGRQRAARCVQCSCPEAAGQKRMQSALRGPHRRNTSLGLEEAAGKNPREGACRSRQGPASSRTRSVLSSRFPTPEPRPQGRAILSEAESASNSRAELSDRAGLGANVQLGTNARRPQSGVRVLGSSVRSVKSARKAEAEPRPHAAGTVPQTLQQAAPPKTNKRLQQGTPTPERSAERSLKAKGQLREQQAALTHSPRRPHWQEMSG